MHPRFSLRLVLIAFALPSVVLYVFVVRPTRLANQFVSAIVQNDYVTAKLLLSNADEWDRVVNPQNSFKADRVYAEVLPRELDDVWRCQRRIVLRVSRHDDRNGNYVNWTEDTDVVAHPRGLEIRIQASYYR